MSGTVIDPENRKLNKAQSYVEGFHSGGKDRQGKGDQGQVGFCPHLLWACVAGTLDIALWTQEAMGLGSSVTGGGG